MSESVPVDTGGMAHGEMAISRCARATWSLCPTAPANRRRKESAPGTEAPLRRVRVRDRRRSTGAGTQKWLRTTGARFTTARPPSWRCGLDHQLGGAPKLDPLFRMFSACDRQKKRPRAFARGLICGRRDLNSYGETPLPPQSSASTNSATTAILFGNLTSPEPEARREHRGYQPALRGSQELPCPEEPWLRLHSGWLA
jgi:hypothetical protein